MDRLRSAVGTTSDRQEAETVPGIYSNNPQLSYEGVDNVTLPDVTNPSNAIPLPTPGTWVDQQLAFGVPLDLETPSLPNLHTAGMDLNNSITPVNPSSTATPEIPTPALANQSIPPHALYQPQEPLPHPRKLMGSSTAFPVPLRLHTQSIAPSEQSFHQTPSQSPVFAHRGGPGLRASQSAVNMSMSYEGLPERPNSSGGAQSSSLRKRGKGIAESGSDEDEDTQEDDKLKLNRERNRLAAAKTRRKKKRSAKETEERAKEIEETNARLHQEVRTLRDAFSTLRYCALSHDPAAGCTCVGIHQYNEHMAKEVAKEVAKGL
ncbi:Putative basic-leucine zipper domain-containing protein [Septoria linicola]|uniref:Basic-leucine zipper domain-containing protein n=1 Tax=Septoria linicola TaxID=215465 RepID=A0A9Q9B5I9_9PEZI|nr:putative basic-leucine zipper domain-containing protein [Septoria linicola]USW59363.1 Putative basic-leucine zipper domain-containing protein [Septoria linicola]